MPCDSTTLSSAVGSSSQPSSYDMPEQPPPTTRTRSAHSGLPSSSRRSEIFFAATSLNVTIQASFADMTAGSANEGQYNRGGGATFQPFASRQSTPPAGSRTSSSRAAFDPSPAMSRAASAT